MGLGFDDKSARVAVLLKEVSQLDSAREPWRVAYRWQRSVSAHLRDYRVL